MIGAGATPSLIGGDQNPLRQGIFRAVAVARRAPDRRVIYAMQDADVAGRPGSAPGLVPHAGSYFSFTFDHPSTPRVRNVSGRLSALFTARGHPPARYEIAGPDLPILGRTHVDEVILAGWESEIAWAERRGADPARVRALRDLVGSLAGSGLVGAVRAIAFEILRASGVAWPPI